MRSWPGRCGSGWSGWCCSGAWEEMGWPSWVFSCRFPRRVWPRLLFGCRHMSPLREKTPTEQHHSLNREHCVLFALAGVFDLISRKAQSFPISIVHTLAQSTSCAPEALLARGGRGERELPMCTPNASVFLSQYELHWAKQNATPDRVPKRLRDGRLWLRSSIAGTKRALFFSMRQRALVLFAPAYSVGVGASSP